MRSAFGCEARSDFSSPTSSTVPVPRSTSTPTPSRTMASPISLPTRARAGPAQVTTCAAFTKSARPPAAGAGIRRNVAACTSCGREQVAEPIHPQWRLGLAAAGVVAPVAGDRSIARVRGPMAIGGEIGTATDAAVGIDVHGVLPGAAGLLHLAAEVPWDLREIVIGVGDDAATAALEGEEFSDERLDARMLALADAVHGVAVLEVGVDREIHPDAHRGRGAHDRHDVVEVVVLDDRVEAHGHPAVADRGGVREDAGREAGDPAGPVVPLVEIIEGNAELADTGVPEGAG